MNPSIRRSNQEHVPFIEAMRKQGNHVLVRFSPGGSVIDYCPVPSDYTPQRGEAVHGPIPYRGRPQPIRTLADVIREVRATNADRAQTSPDDEVIEEQDFDVPANYGGTD